MARKKDKEEIKVTRIRPEVSKPVEKVEKVEVEPPKPKAPPKPKYAPECKEFCELYEKLDIDDMTFAGWTGVSLAVIERWKTVASAPKSVIDLLKHKVAQL